MKHLIKIADLISSDIRSRNNAERIIEVVDIKNNYVLDFTGVEFMSRSFTDELCNIIDSNGNITIDRATMEKQVESIYTIVNRGRHTERQRTKTSEEVVQLKTFEDVCKFFAAF